MEPSRSSDKSILTKRKRSDDISPTNDRKIRENATLSKSISTDESTKRPKLDVPLRHNSIAVSINVYKEIYGDIVFFRNSKFIVSFMIVVIWQNRIGSIVHQDVFVVILMIHFKLFNEAKEWYDHFQHIPLVFFCII
jgi:hypothetical protein